MELEKYDDCNDLDQKKENTVQVIKGLVYIRCLHIIN